MTVFMTPDREPFYCGTYFPRELFQPLIRACRGGLARGPRAGVERQAQQVGRRAGARGSGAGGSGRRGPATPGPRWRPRPPGVERGGQRWPTTTTPRTAGSAARRSSRRPWCWSSCCGIRPAAPGRPGALAMAEQTMDGDGPRRHVRPARRRLRPVLGGRRLGGAALREDALRQRAAGPGLRAPVAADRLAARPPDRRADLRLDGPGAAHRRGRAGLRAGRRQRGRGRQVLRLDPGAADARARPGRTARSRPELFEVTAAGTFERGPSVLQLRRRSRRRGPAAAGARGAAGRPRAAGPAGPRRQGGRGLERAGHRRAGRDRAAARPPRPGRRRARRRRADRPRPPPGRPRWRGRPGTARRATAPGCSRTTPASPKASSPCPGLPATPAGAPGRAAAGHRAGPVR